MSREVRCPICGVPLGTPHHPGCVEFRRSRSMPSPEDVEPDPEPTQEEDECED